MNADKIIEKFKKNILIAEKMSKYSWFNLGGPADIFFKPKDKDQLINFLKEAKNLDKSITLLGAGSNTLIRDKGCKGIVIKLSPKFARINISEPNIIEVGAATLDKSLARFASEHSLSGFEFLSCIPGSVGGAIVMNSGCYGDDISKIIASVKTIDFQGKEYEFKKKDINFFYRGNDIPKNHIIISAKFKGTPSKKEDILLKQKRFLDEKKISQPSQIKTCGSTFKNPENLKAWKLIKDSQCQLIKCGGASISEKHYNFFVNEGNASSKDIEDLIKKVQNQVEKKFNIQLDLEIKIIGEQ